MGRERSPHVGIYGVSNAGKSSLLNRITGQQAVIVSAQAGTTTDPVRRVYEIANYGPVVFIDTAGVDDTTSELGLLRVQRTLQSLTQVDLAIVLLVGDEPNTDEHKLLRTIQDNDVSVVLLPCRGDDSSTDEILLKIRENIPELSQVTPPFFGEHIINSGDVILFICPIDDSAPAGRLILPQVQAFRATLDLGAIIVSVQLSQLKDALKMQSPQLIVTDSQAFGEVTTIIREADVKSEVTSFSILLAEQKGNMRLYREGLRTVDSLKEGDRVLIIENCSHQITCDDIGRSKIPAWLKVYTGIDNLEFAFVSGRDPLPIDIQTKGYYALAIQCGGCVSTRRMVQSRIQVALKNGVPITNYGMLIRKLRTGQPKFGS